MYILREYEGHCPKCGWMRNPVPDDYDPVNYCAGCETVVDDVRECDPEWVCVAAYDTQTEYGGPEEGGWYFESGARIDSTVRCFEAGDMPQVRLYHQRLCKEFGEVRVYGDRIAPEKFPDRRPFYH